MCEVARFATELVQGLSQHWKAAVRDDGRGVTQVGLGEDTSLRVFVRYALQVIVPNLEKDVRTLRDWLRVAS